MKKNTTLKNTYSEGQFLILSFIWVIHTLIGSFLSEKFIYRLVKKTSPHIHMTNSIYFL